MCVANTCEDNDKTVVCQIRRDEDMPYLTTQYRTDENGFIHPVGIRERVDLITNPLAIVNRTIPMVLLEGSVTFILDKTRKYAANLKSRKEKEDLLFDILTILNPKHGKDVVDLYNNLKSEKEKDHFIEDCISLNPDSTLRTDNGLYSRWDAFNDEHHLRDAIAEIYDKYPNIMKPYHIFVPKPKWGKDLYIGDDYIGYQYIMMLKQSGEKGFSVRSAGAISDESLPEKSNSNKSSKLWRSEKPIRFGEYETPNFLIVTQPEDFALMTALYRSSVDGRRYMYEAIISDDAEYNLPKQFTSRTAQILQVYLKSLGVCMETIIDEDEFIGEEEHDTQIVGYEVGSNIIYCTPNEMYYLKKLHKIHKRYMKENPNTIDDVDEAWDYILEHLTFKKKYLTNSIVTIFKDNWEAFSTL